MTVMRMVVEDVDVVLGAFSALGYEATERWGPPFAILEIDDLEIWISGPGSSAYELNEQLSSEVRGHASHRLVHVSENQLESALEFVAAGWEIASEVVDGPGGSQQLLRSGTVYIEVFQST